jgi:hypothetical protein
MYLFDVSDREEGVTCQCKQKMHPCVPCSACQPSVRTWICVAGGTRRHRDSTYTHPPPHPAQNIADFSYSDACPTLEKARTNAPPAEHTDRRSYRRQRRAPLSLPLCLSLCLFPCQIYRPTGLPNLQGMRTPHSSSKTQPAQLSSHIGMPCLSAGSCGSILRLGVLQRAS